MNEDDLPEDVRHEIERRMDPNRSRLENLKKRNAAALGGRQMIVTFKKGGRIEEDHVYDSADESLESQDAISAVLMAMLNPKTLQYEIGSHMIGNGFMGWAPWESLDDFVKICRIADKSDPEFQKAKLRAGSPMRIQNFIEQPCGTILVTIESV